MYERANSIRVPISLRMLMGTTLCVAGGCSIGAAQTHSVPIQITPFPTVSVPQVPSPPPGPWHSLDDFCAPNPTNLPAYHGLRVCVLNWLLHYETNKEIYLDVAAGQDLGVSVNRSTAMNLAKALKIDLSPTFDYSKFNAYTYPYVTWSWRKPTAAPWANYVFCNYVTVVVFRVPSQGGDDIQLGWISQKSDSWTYLSGGTYRDSSPHHDVEIGVEVNYLLIHKDDRVKGLNNKICSQQAPND